jgi:amphiphysin
VAGSQLKIASVIDQFYDDGAPMGIYGVKYKEAVVRLDQQAQDELVRIQAIEPHTTVIPCQHSPLT